MCRRSCRRLGRSSKRGASVEGEQLCSGGRLNRSCWTLTLSPTAMMMVNLPEAHISSWAGCLLMHRDHQCAPPQAQTTPRVSRAWPEGCLRSEISCMRSYEHMQLQRTGQSAHQWKFQHMQRTHFMKQTQKNEILSCPCFPSRWGQSNHSLHPPSMGYAVVTTRPGWIGRCPPQGCCQYRQNLL